MIRIYGCGVQTSDTSRQRHEATTHSHARMASFQEGFQDLVSVTNGAQWSHPVKGKIVPYLGISWILLQASLNRWPVAC